MGNYGILYLQIYDRDILAVQTINEVISARGTAYLNRVGNGECTIKVQSSMVGIVKGNIACCYISDAIAGGAVSVCAFTIEEIHYKTQRDGMSEVRISGRDMLGELSGYLHFVDIGDTYATTLANNELIDSDVMDVADIGATKTYIDNYQPGQGALHVDVNDASAFAAGDSIILQQDEDEDGGHLTVITNIAANAIAFADALPGDNMSAFGEVYIPEVWEGDSVKIELDAGGYHYSRISHVPAAGINAGSSCDIRIVDGLISAAASGNDVIVISSHTETTTDITDIMAQAVADGWTATDLTAAGSIGTGTASPGTAHSVDGATTMQLLIQCNDLTSEWFRLERTSATLPNRKLKWSNSATESTGITLSMPSTQATGISTYADTTKGIIHSLTAETRFKIATAVVAKGGSDLFDLGDATVAASAGFTKELWNGVWRVTNDAGGLADYTYVHYVTFNNVVETVDVEWALIEAANELLKQAETYLENNDSSEEFKRVRAVIHDDIMPGQSMALSYTETTALRTGNWSDGSSPVFIVECTHSVGRNGVRYTDLLLSETSPYNRETAETDLVTASSGGSVTSSGGGGGGGGGATHDAVTVTSIPAGMLTITGQALTFKLVAGDGLASASTVLSIDRSTDSGLQITSGELEMGDGGSVTVSSANDVSGASHTHAADITVAGAASKILATDASGHTQVVGIGVNTAATGAKIALSGDIDMTGDINQTGQINITGDIAIDGDIDFTGAQEITTDGGGNLTLNPAGDLDVNATLEFQGAQSIKTSTGDLTVNPAGDVIFDADDNNIHLVTATDIGGQNYAPAGASAFTTEWKIDTGLGAGYFEYLEADQMHIRLFQADVTMAKGNGLIVTDSVAVLSADFTLPAIDATVDIYVDDNPALGTVAVFASGDWVRMRAFKRDSGLSLFDVWGTVASYVDQTDGTQKWTMTFKEPSGAVGLTVQAGAPVLGYGTSGQGWWEVDARRDIGPFTRVGTWAGSDPYTAANRTNHIMTGNLNSVTSQGDYGFYAAVGSPAGPRIVISDREASFHQIPISLYSGTPDGGQILLYSLKLNSDVESTVFPNGDLTGENVTKNGTPVETYYYEYIDDWTDSANYIQNTASKSGHRWFNMADISHTLTTLEIVIYATKSAFVDDTCQLRAQMFKSDGTTELTDEVKVFSEKSTSDSQVTIQFTGVDTTALDGEWSAARLKLSWVYHVGGGDEVIKLEPNMEVGPYIAVGYPLPTDYDTTGIGFWVGKDPADDAYKMRIGEAGGAALLWDGTTDAEELIIRDGDGNAVITFQEDGDSFFSGVMNIATAGEIQQGTGAVGVDFTGFRLYNSSNYGMFSTYDSDSEIVRVDGVDGIKVFISDAWVENEAYTFHSVSGGNVGGMYGSYQPVVQYNIVRILSRTNTSGYTASVSLQGYGPSSGDGVVFMRADSDDGSGTDVELTVKSVYSGVDYINMAGADVNIEEGLSVGASAGQAVDEGQLILNQGTGDGDIIRLISSDVAHGMTTNKPTNVYGSFSKAISDDGGLSIYGWSESEYGSILYGMAGTSDTSESTSSKAAVCAMSYKKTGTTVGAFDADDNIFIARNATTTQFIIKGDGEVYSNYATAMTAFPDAEDDMALISTVADTLSGSILKTEWDDFVTYNRDDLARLDIVTKTGFVNTHNITKLFIGAFRQLNGRIAELEAQIGKTN